jgi:cysteine desulfurase
LACRSLFESTITAALPDSIIVGTQTNRSPHISNVVFPGVESEILVSRLRGEIGISSASACNSFLTQPSHVLLAMGFPEAAALSSIRASFAPTTSLDAVRTAAARLCAVVTCIRSATESVN